MDQNRNHNTLINDLHGTEKIERFNLSEVRKNGPKIYQDFTNIVHDECLCLCLGRGKRRIEF